MLKRFLKGGDDQSLMSAERLLIIMTAAVLVILVGLQYASAQARKRDNERRLDLYTIQLSVQKYFSLNGSYPTSLGILSDIPSKACTDPSGKGTCQDPDYTYEAFARGTIPKVGLASNCDNTKTGCAGYLLLSNHMETTLNPYVVMSN